MSGRGDGRKKGPGSGKGKEKSSDTEQRRSKSPPKHSESQGHYRQRDDTRHRTSGQQSSTNAASSVDVFSSMPKMGTTLPEITKSYTATTRGSGGSNTTGQQPSASPALLSPNLGNKGPFTLGSSRATAGSRSSNTAERSGSERARDKSSTPESSSTDNESAGPLDPPKIFVREQNPSPESAGERARQQQRSD